MPRLSKTVFHEIAAYVQRAPGHLLAELAHGDTREGVATALGEIIVANLTKVHLELFQTSEPPLTF
jgi:hypothetical protein